MNGIRKVVPAEAFREANELFNMFTNCSWRPRFDLEICINTFSQKAPRRTSLLFEGHRKGLLKLSPEVTQTSDDGNINFPQRKTRDENSTMTFVIENRRLEGSIMTSTSELAIVYISFNLRAAWSRVIL